MCEPNTFDLAITLHMQGSEKHVVVANYGQQGDLLFLQLTCSYAQRPVDAVKRMLGLHCRAAQCRGICYILYFACLSCAIRLFAVSCAVTVTSDPKIIIFPLGNSLTWMQ